jgi:16S rRNA (cytosine967-C5)-methyltransferase
MPSPPLVTIAPARACAYTVLRRVFEQGAYADRALTAAAADLAPRDRGLAMRLSYGAVQRKGTLDHLIEALAERPVAALDPPLVAALRIGLYELLYLRGAPDYAVVADSVELAKSGARGGHGLVNAVLRRAAREGPDALLATLGDATPEQAAIKHSHPEWIAQLWWDSLGADDTRALMAADNEPLEVALRANTLIGDADALAAQLTVSIHRDPQIPEALVLDEPFDVHGSELWQAGAFHAQSRAAMHVARTLDPAPGERVLDLCAAPGGKSTHLAALMHDQGVVHAVERNPRRAGSLVRTAQRLHVGNVIVEVADAEQFSRTGRDPEMAAFDRVLVDPPCSGLGTLQARADLRWRVSPQAIDEMVGVQSKILAAGAHALRPGGVLVYSTCTISTNENEHLIAAFLDSHTDFDLAGTVVTLPHRDHTAGFYIARLRKS